MAFNWSISSALCKPAIGATLSAGGRPGGMGAAPRADIQTATTGETGVDIQFFGPAALQDVVEYLFCTVFVKAVVAPIRYQVTQQTGMINGRSVVAKVDAGPVVVGG